MDPITVQITALVVGVSVAGIVIKSLLFRAYDKARNTRVRQQNAKYPPASTKLADLHNKNN